MQLRPNPSALYRFVSAACSYRNVYTMQSGWGKFIVQLAFSNCIVGIFASSKITDEAYDNTNQEYIFGYIVFLDRGVGSHRFTILISMSNKSNIRPMLWLIRSSIDWGCM